MKLNCFSRVFLQRPQLQFSSTIMRSKHTLISIEGNIGSGKSTLLNLMQQKYKKIKYIQEPVQEWQNINGDQNLNLLKEFYGDPKRWAYTIRLMHWKSILDEEEFKEQNSIILSERSIQADKQIFAINGHNAGLINDLEFALYNNFYNWLVLEIFGKRIEKQIIIYLRVDPRISYERIQKRERFEEKDSIKLDYLEQIHQRHEEWIKMDIENCHILTIDGNQEFETQPKRQQELFSEIDEFLLKLVKNI